QADPNVPQRLLELAAPIAQAMGALHQIERSGGVQLNPNAPTALAHLQTAMAELQATPPQHAAVATALEAVAAALGNVHTLARAAAQPAAMYAPPPPAGHPGPPAAECEPAGPSPACAATRGRACRPQCALARPAPGGRAG